MNKILITIAVVLSLVLLYIVSCLFEVRIRDNEYGLKLIGGSRGDHTVEGFESSPAHLTYTMGPYSNIAFNLGNGEHFIRKNTSLLSSDLYVPAGTPLPLRPKVSKEPSYTNGPNVDGTKQSPKAMSMMKYNQCKPECCPGTYSCSGGCVCLTKNQSEFINSRGNNRTKPSNY